MRRVGSHPSRCRPALHLAGSFLPALLVAGLSVPASPCPTSPVPAPAEEGLAGLVRAYGKAKDALPRSGRERGQAVRETLEPVLLRIAALGTSESLRFLEREHADPSPEVAVAAGKALLGSPRPEGVAAVVRGMRRSGTWSLSGRVEILDALVLTGREDALAFVVRTASRGDAETRLLAIGSLRLAPTSAAALAALVEALRSPSYAVRNAALRALAAFEPKTAIAPLIDLIEREKDEKLRTDALRRLVELTGYNMGFVAADWRKWWELAEERFEPGKKDGAATSVVPHDLRYFGIEVTSKRLAFLIDTSLSMHGAGTPEARKRGERRPPAGERKIDVLKEELGRLLGELPGDTLVNIVSFDRTFHPWKGELHSLEGSGREEAVGFVRGLECRGGTNIHDTLEFALGDRRVDTIYILSDGHPVGGKFSRPEDILREIGALNRIRGATIHTISFGQENELMRRLARDNGGTYRAIGVPERRARGKESAGADIDPGREPIR